MTPDLTGELQRQVRLLEDDLRDRVTTQSAVLAAWQAEHRGALDRGRTAAVWEVWRDDRVTQAAVAWVLTTVFVKFCEDNALVAPVWIGQGRRLQEALDAQHEYFRAHNEDTDREWLEQAVVYLASLPATRALVDGHSPLHTVSPSGDAATALLNFWRERGEDGSALRDLTSGELSTRFLGDLYQDLSQHAKDTYALLQTPEFVEEFILDRTLAPALAERPLDGFRLIDPTCGSGHFLLGAFARLLDRWHRHAPGLETQARVQAALDAIHGVDLNPFAVAIARFRLTIAALRACGLRHLEDAPAFSYHLACGDSLLHGSVQHAIDYGPDYDIDAGAAGFAYSSEDLGALRQILQPRRYDVVVGNPPYLQAKDKSLNAKYRERYHTCHGKYALTVPFMERFFGLAIPSGSDRPVGWVGQITSNSFMKREFGAPLIEQFLSRRDLRLVADTSGAHIPGHGTPTVIIVGRPQSPVGETVRAVLGIRGEPERPPVPAKATVWRSITEHVDEPGHDDGWTATTDLDRNLLARHPWSLTGGGTVELQEALDRASSRLLGTIASEIGIVAVIGEELAFELPANTTEPSTLFVLGDGIRDYSLSAVKRFCPYGSNLAVSEAARKSRWMWPSRSVVSGYLMFGKTRSERGLEWLEYGMLARSKLRGPLSIAFAFVATHNHFVLDRGGKLFKQTAPVIKLPEGASEDAHLELLGVLNSSTACFWLKQACFDKGVGGIGGGIGDEKWEPRYEFSASAVKDLPLPSALPLGRGRSLDALAQELAWHTPVAVCGAGTPTRERLDAARAEHDRIRARMIAVQEELDWEVYRLYGLVTEDLTYNGDGISGLALGERAFEIALARAVEAGEEETAWFERHGSTSIGEVPSHWPVGYRGLVQRRLDLIANDPSIRLLEKPEYKRRWSLQAWEKREQAALRGWLLDRLEDRGYWFDPQGRPLPRSVAQLADVAARDRDLVGVLALWEGRPDVPVTDSLQRLLSDEAVPYLAAYRYKEPGLRKRATWERTWELQRREDAGEQVAPIPVPPKYTSADFARKSYWDARGKLDVPKERFIAYPDAGRDTDPTPLLGWAGWDHAEQALALGRIVTERETEGWADERLVPLVAGLAELQPWVAQWHAQLHPTYGISLAAYCDEELTRRCAQVGHTREQLASWPPASPRRGRRVGTRAT